MSSAGVITSFIKKEFRQIMRSREMLIVLFALPAVQLLVMGFAVTNEVKNLRLGILDYDRSASSRDLISSGMSSALAGRTTGGMSEVFLVEGLVAIDEVRSGLPTLAFPKGVALLVAHKNQHAGPIDPL